MPAIDCYDQVGDVSRFRAGAMDETFVDCFVCGSETRSKHDHQHELARDRISVCEDGIPGLLFLQAQRVQQFLFFLPCLA
jgi:hypothetical protein